jgi:hypothetical protein
MGRYYWDKKDTVEDCRSVSISFLKKHDYFSSYGYTSGVITWTHGWSGNKNSIGIGVFVDEYEKYARFYYTVTDRNSGEKTDYDYKVQLTTTSCNYGGVRYWFICPLYRSGVYCGRRIGTLYCPPGANYYGCRHCYNLSYESRNEPRLGRFGGIGFPLKIECQIEKLYGQIKRWTYGGKPTKKARKLQALKQRFRQGVAVSKMLLKR